MNLYIYIALCVISALFCAWYARKNGDSLVEWFVLGLCYPPFVSIPAVLFCARKLQSWV